jgi:hypothetical protein
MKDAKLIGLIADSVEATTVSPGERLSSAGFLGPSPAVQVILYPSEMGEPLQRDDLDGAGVGEVEVGVIGYLEVVQDAKSCYHTMGISFEGGEKGFLDLLTLSNEGQCQEDPASVPKPKGSRDVKNLECSISFDVRSIRSCWGKGKKTIHGM